MSMRKMFSKNQIKTIAKDVIDSEIRGLELVKSGTTVYDTENPGYIDFETPLYTDDVADGLYLFTYSNVYTFVPITAEALVAAQTYPIKVAMPVIYAIDGSFRPGTCLIRAVAEEDDGGTPTGKYVVVIRVVDGVGDYALDGLGFNIWRTKIF